MSHKNAMKKWQTNRKKIADLKETRPTNGMVREIMGYIGWESIRLNIGIGLFIHIHSPRDGQMLESEISLSERNGR